MSQAGPPESVFLYATAESTSVAIADVPAVREYAKTLPYVVHVEDNLFTCSQDTQEKMKQVIKEKDLNRVVVASCSPRTHEPLFRRPSAMRV